MELATVNDETPSGNRGLDAVCPPLALDGTDGEKWRRREWNPLPEKRNERHPKDLRKRTIRSQHICSLLTAPAFNSRAVGTPKMAGGWSGLSLEATESPDEATVDGVSFEQYFSKQLDDRRNLRKNRRLGEEILAATVS